MAKLRRYSDLSEIERGLIDAALDVSANAYAPYSGFAVGAAVRTKSGAVYLGANLENASYGLSMCAEVAAITRANSEGDYDIETIAVVGHKFTDPRDFTQIVTPCGRCRQLISEAGQVAKHDVVIFSCSGDRERVLESNSSYLLPEAFGPENLGLENVWPQMRTKLHQSVKELQKRAPGGESQLPRASQGRH